MSQGANVGKYVLQGELARGGMGVVYRALDPVLRRPCALKVLLGEDADPAGVERFLREARALARLRHPGIVDVHDAGTERGRPFLVMELIEGGSLASLVRDEGPLPERRALELVDRIARAVDAAHAEGILHRDLKPANVLLAGDGSPRVTDFGLARDLTGREQAITFGDQMLGTPHYMSPEQAGGENERVGPRSDVYGLGAVLFELLTGAPPYEGTTAINVVTRILREPPPSPRARRPELAPDVDLIVRKAMAKAPEDRYDSAAALAADIRRFLEGRPIEARPAGAVERAWKWTRRHRAVAGLLGGVLLAVGVGAGLGVEALNLRRRAEARELEARGLAALEGALRAGGEGAARVEADLARATALDPDRAAVWRARARLAVERGDPDAARAHLARAGAGPGERGEADYVRGRLAEAAADLAAASAAYAGAQAAGSREPDLGWREARVAALVASARGHVTSAEQAWFDVLRERADDDGALRALVDGWLARRDLEALDRGWEEVLRRTSDDGRGWQAVTQGDLEAVSAALPDTDAPTARRVHAALAASLLQWRSVYERLVAVRAAPEPFGEAVRSTELATGAIGFPEWAAVAAVTTWADGAAPALTLLEHAHRLRPGDGAALLTLAREARAPLLRGAVALAAVVAATREGSVSLAEATALLDRLRGDPEARVRGAAEDAAAALEVLRGRGPRPCPPGALRLARGLLRAQERRGPLVPDDRPPDDPWRVACTATLQQAPDADLLVARAEDALERMRPGEALAAASADVEAALALAPHHLCARCLAAQLRLLGGAEAELEALPDDDPAAVAAARARVAFARAYAAAALEAAGGAIRIVSSPADPGFARAFEVLSPEAALDAEGLTTLGVTLLRSRFRLSEVRTFTVSGEQTSGDPTGFVLRTHAPAAGGLGAYFLSCSLRNPASVRVDGERLLEGPPFPHARTGVTAVLRRGHATLRSATADAIDGRLVARTSRAHGFVDVEWGWGAGPFRLRRVVIVGRWDGAADAWPALPPARPLRPARDELPLVAEHVPSAPATLGALRRAGASFRIDGTWVGSVRRGNVICAPGLRGDVRLRARVVLRTSARYAHAGLALRASLGPDAVFLNLVLPEGAPGDLQERRLWMSLQRGDEWEKPFRAVRAELDRGTVLELERRGDHVIARAGPTVEQLAPVGEPIYFPMGELDACVMGRTTVGSTGQAIFSDVELLLPE